MRRVDAANLIEAWACHTLNWITRWDGEGVKPVHDEWRGLVHGMGEDLDIDGKIGIPWVDESFGLLLRQVMKQHYPNKVTKGLRS